MPPRKHKNTSLLLPLALSTPLLFSAASGANIFKADNTDNLDTGTSWDGGIAPGSGDVAVWDNRVTSPNTSYIGNTSTWGSIQVLDPVGTAGVYMSASRTLTLANGGIDATLASSDFQVTMGSNAWLRIANGNYSPGVAVAPGRTVTINSQLINQGNTKTFGFSGGGNVVINNHAGSGGAMNFNISGGTSVAMNGATNGWTYGIVSDGTLTGDGTTTEINLQPGGIIAPGNSIGTMTIQGADTFNYLDWHGAGAGVHQMAFELSNVDNLSDMLRIGSLSEPTSFLTKFTDTGDFYGFDFLGTGAANQTYTLIEFTTLGDVGAGTFSADDFSYTNLGSGLTGTFSMTSNSLQFTTVPEPSIALLGALGLVGIFFRRR